MPDGLAQTDSLLAALADPTILLDGHTDRVLAWNPAAARLLAGRPDAPAAPHLAPFLADSLPSFIVFMQEVDYRGTAFTRDVRLGGALPAAHLELRAGRLPDGSGRVLLQVLDVDALDRRTQTADTKTLHRAGLEVWQRAEGFFAELERRNQLILNAAGEGIYGINAEGCATFVNRAAQEMLGWTSEDLLGRNIHAMIHHHHLNGEVYPARDCPIYQSFRFEKVHRIEDEVFWRKDGRPIRVEYVSTPIYDQQVLAGAVVIFRDITERKENERKLHEALSEVAALRDRLEQENAYLQEAVSSARAHHDIVGSSPIIRQIRARIDVVAGTDATVLISGETGTGKALIANAIHKTSGRSRRTMIHFKCSSVGPDQVEAELFGQVRGAYPGAARDRPGKLELADGGTLFLEDVADLPLETQGRLHQSLQNGTVTRLGDQRARPVDIRVIAAMTDPPERAIRDGRLREDLAFLLNVFPIACHPLRERSEDIPHLVEHLLALSCQRLNLPKPVVTERAMAQLTAYDWPGNVRELHNILERAAIISNGGKLVVDISGAGLQQETRDVIIRTEAEIDRMIRENLVACMRATGGRVAGAGGAAEVLGVRPTTLYSRLKKYGIGRSDYEVAGAVPHKAVPRCPVW
ncbi:sigma 54-interacting transcriptional regulator [Rhodosalinus sp.]|uniref:sigma 54-interacting transcriptional regulator n=1 Tax=Rhodosalinus sp. TaxID=2047741 RepID=UPI00397C4161